MNRTILNLLLVLTIQLLVQEALAKPARNDDKILKALDKGKSAKARKYLLNFGYMSDYFSDEKKFKKSLKHFQYYAKIPITGEIDDKTVEQMQKPRCGMKDPTISFEVGRKRRYNLQGGKWEFPAGSDRTLTWYLKNAGSTISYQKMRLIIKEALDKWQQVANINFKESSDSGKADLFVSFGSYSHGDPYSFDGRGGTLAHAFYPLKNYDIGGDIHFDNDEYFTYKEEHGTDIVWVATHEAGHSLGLEHSYEQSAIMYAWYQAGHRGVFDLTPDDVRGIQALYGKRPEPVTTKEPATTKAPTTTQEPTTTTLPPTTTQEPTTTTLPPTTTQEPTTTTLPPTTTQEPTTTEAPPQPTTRSVTKPTKPPGMKDCMATIDAVVDDPSTGWVYIFTGKTFFLASKRGLRYGPIQTDNYFRAVKGKITAAYVRQNDFSLILFSGDKYYIYKDFGLVQDERPVTDFGLPAGTTVDAALQWQGSSRTTWTPGTRTYLFSGTQYYRFNEITKKIDDFYPRRISGAWRGLPSTVSGAVTWFDTDDGKETYFVAGNNYYIFDDEYIKVKPGHPRHISKWLNCWHEDAPPQLRFPSIGEIGASEVSAGSAGSSP